MRSILGWVSIAGIAAAVTLAAVVMLGDWPSFGVPDPAPESTADRLAFAMRWMLVPALTLMMGLGAAHSQRALNPRATSGERAGAGHFLEIVLRYNINTVEQFLLALAAWTGLALTLPPDQLDLIPRAAVLFGVGRVLFFWGYLWTPPARLLGMGLTAYPTYAALLWLAWNVVAQA